MADSSAYLPNSIKKQIGLVRKTRRLPLPGEVLVKKGDVVYPDTPVALSLIHIYAVEAKLHGGLVGVILDGRGRPIAVSYTHLTRRFLQGTSEPGIDS